MTGNGLHGEWIKSDGVQEAWKAERTGKQRQKPIEKQDNGQKPFCNERRGNWPPVEEEITTSCGGVKKGHNSNGSQ